ncbi:MAG: hypothetical protein AAFV80_18345, partial [Bacteroidota bacterium]
PRVTFSPPSEPHGIIGKTVGPVEVAGKEETDVKLKHKKPDIMFILNQMKKGSIKLLVFSLVFAFVFSACKKESEMSYPEQEQPTEETNMYTETNKGAPFLYDFNQIDPIVYTPFTVELMELMLFYTPEEYLFQLFDAIDFAAQNGNEVLVFLGLLPIDDFNAALNPAIHFAPQAANILARDYAPFQKNGFYEVTNLLMIDTEGDQNLFDLQSIDAEAVKKASQKGGICATLAIAHSLVHRNQIIPEDGRGTWPETSETENGKQSWNPDFLKKVYEATGDEDGHRGLTDDQMEEGHTADWSSDWEVKKSKDMTNVATPGTNPTASQLQAWCREMKKFIEQEQDDCILRVRGTLTYKDENGDTKTRRVGHAMTINSVEEKNGNCVIKVVDTAKQDPNKDWEDVPYNPGDQEWTIGTNGTSISRNNHWGTSIVWDEIAYFCFDEDPKRNDVQGTDRGTPGTALQ